MNTTAAAAATQIQELAAAIANQAEALAAGKIPVGSQQGQVALMESNVATLKAWIMSAEAVAGANGGRCPGCGEIFNGPRGLRAHQSQKFVTLACKPR